MTDLTTPLFVGGCDRSGTTMLGAMLGSHSKVLCVPEGQFITDIYGHAMRRGYTDDIMATIDSINRHPRFRLWGIGRLSDKDPGLNSGSSSYYADLMLNIVELYAARVRKAQYSIWVDHVPSNIKSAITLLDLFPNARFIHIIRDGRAVASSMLSVKWGYNSVDRIAMSWIDYAAHGLAAEAAMGDRILRITYEELVTNSEETLRKICLHVGLHFESAMIAGKGLVLPTFYRKDEKLVGSLPDATRIGSWQKTLSPRDIEIFEYLAGALLQHFGYSTQYYPGAKGMTTRERLGSLLRLPLEALGNYYSHARLIWATTPRKTDAR